MSAFAEFVAHLFHILSVVVSWIVQAFHSMMSSLDRSHPPPELPLTSFDPRPTVGITGAPYVRLPSADVMERIHAGPPRKLLSNSSGAEPVHGQLTRNPYSRSSKSHDMTFQDSASDIQSIRSPYSSDPAGLNVSSLPSPALSFYYNPAFPYSVTPPLSVSCPSLVQDLSQLSFSRPRLQLVDENRLSVPSLDTQINSLGKRRGFKGAPLSTSSSSLKFLPSTLSLLGRRSLIDWPSSPRSPLEAVTNIMRTKKSHIRNVSPDMQDFFDQADPFSTFSDSFYTVTITFSIIPTSNINDFSAYIVDSLSASRTQSIKRQINFSNHQCGAPSPSRKKIFMKTTIYDMSVADVPAKPIGSSRNLDAKPVPRAPSPRIVLTLPSLPPSPVAKDLRLSPLSRNIKVVPIPTVVSMTISQSTSNATIREVSSEDIKSQSDKTLTLNDYSSQDSDLSLSLPALPPVSLHDLGKFFASDTKAVGTPTNRSPTVPSAGIVTPTQASYRSVSSVAPMKVLETRSEPRVSYMSKNLPPSATEPAISVSMSFTFVLPDLDFMSSLLSTSTSDDARIRECETPLPKYESNVKISNLREEDKAVTESTTVFDENWPGSPTPIHRKKEIKDESLETDVALNLSGVPPAAVDTAPPDKPDGLGLSQSKTPKRKTTLRAASQSWTLPDKPRRSDYGRHRRSVAVDDKAGKTISSMSVCASPRTMDGVLRAGSKRRTKSLGEVLREDAIVDQSQKDPFVCAPLPLVPTPRVRPPGSRTHSRSHWPSVAARPLLLPALAPWGTEGSPLIPAKVTSMAESLTTANIKANLNRRLSNLSPRSKRRSRALDDIISLLDDARLTTAPGDRRQHWSEEDGEDEEQGGLEKGTWNFNAGFAM